MSIHERTKAVLSSIMVTVLGRKLEFVCTPDENNSDQCYITPKMIACDNFKPEDCNYGFTGRTWLLQEWMQDDDIIKTCYTCVRVFIDHEVMEGFQIHGKAPFSPHHHIQSLLDVQETWHGVSGTWRSPHLEAIFKTVTIPNVDTGAYAAFKATYNKQGNAPAELRKKAYG
jgi:hypothetical protein